MLTAHQRKAPAIAAATIAFALAGITIAGAEAPPDIIKVRQHGLKDLGAAFKVVRDEFKGGSPDNNKIRSAAAEIKKAAAAIPDWFPAGSGPVPGIKTAAKPEIWSDAPGFAAARDAFVEHAGKFAVLADSGDMAALGGESKLLGQSCGGCHDKFRVKQD